jgi:hypothetical protein
MRRVLEGYAVSFNRRYRRSGHLFQNRYKSVLVEEEPYLLELVRYIHLNPVRRQQVEGLDTLDDYRWSGHAVLMGRRSCEWQEIPVWSPFFSVQVPVEVLVRLRIILTWCGERIMLPDRKREEGRIGGSTRSGRRTLRVK